MSTEDRIRKAARIEVGKSLIQLEQTAILELYEFYFDPNFAPFRFHGGTNGIVKDIIYSGNKYSAIAVETEGFESNIMGRLPRPKVTVANIDGTISSIMRNYSDFRDSRFVRIKVFLKHIDNENFEGNVNPFGVPNSLMYISKEKFLVSQKLIENSKLVQFELITPFDLESLQTATRAIYGRYCYWQYRGCGCEYKGDLIEKDDGTSFTFQPLQHIRNTSISFASQTYQDTALFYLWKLDTLYSVGDIVSIKNSDFAGLKDPPFTWFVCVQKHTSETKLIPGSEAQKYWQKDGCNKTMLACRKRFGNIYNSDKTVINDSIVNNGVLPFGGFPGTDSFRYE